MEATASSGRLQRRRIDDGETAGPARGRRRWRRLGEELGLQLLLDDEVEGGEHDGLAGLSSSARWPRRPRRCAPVMLRAAMNSSGRERRRALEGGMERGSSWASPGVKRWRGEGSRQAGGVAAARLARWHSTEQLGGAGGGRRPPCPWWAGWAGWAGSAWATGKFFSIFCLIFPFFFFFIFVLVLIKQISNHFIK